MELLSQETVLGFAMALREGGNVCQRSTAIHCHDNLLS